MIYLLIGRSWVNVAPHSDNIINRVELSGDFGFSNRFSLKTGAIFIPGLGDDQIDLGVGGMVLLRVAPFNSSDLGYPGYPYDARDIGHVGNFYFGAGAGFTYLMFDDQPSSGMVLEVIGEVGYRWYPLRTFSGVNPSLGGTYLLDDLFVDIPLIISYDLTEFIPFLGSDYDQYEDWIDPYFQMFRLGISLGLTF